MSLNDSVNVANVAKSLVKVTVQEIYIRSAVVPVNQRGADVVGSCHCARSILE